MRYGIFLLIFPFLLHAEIVWHAATQKPFELTIKLSSQKMALDDFLDVEAEFRYPSSYQLKEDALLEQLIWSPNPLAPSFSLYQSILSSPSLEGDLKTQHLQVKISPLQTGLLNVSFLIINFFPKDESQLPVSILTPIFNIQVLPLVMPTTSLPAAPLIPLDEQFPLNLTQVNRQALIENPERIEIEKKRLQRVLDSHTFPWLSLMLLIGFAGMGWIAYLTRESWFKQPLKTLPTLSPKEQIDKNLEALQNSQSLTQELIPTYYADLASVLLQTLQAKLSKKPQELTTLEWAYALKDENALTYEQKLEGLTILTEIDEVKFADKKPSLDAAQYMFQRVKNFIQQLYP